MKENRLIPKDAFVCIIMALVLLIICMVASGWSIATTVKTITQTPETYAANMNRTYPVTYIDGKPYAVRLLVGGKEYPEPNEWDTALDTLDDKKDLLNYNLIPFWCQDVKTVTHSYPTFRHIDHPVLRGLNDIRGHGLFTFGTVTVNGFVPTGYRPVLEPLNELTRKPETDSLKTIADGTVLTFGTLYMEDNPVEIPLDPQNIEEITSYQRDAALLIGDSDSDENNLISWVKCGNLLICDRILLKGISWYHLYTNNLTGTEYNETIVNLN